MNILFHLVHQFIGPAKLMISFIVIATASIGYKAYQMASSFMQTSPTAVKEQNLAPKGKDANTSSKENKKIDLPVPSLPNKTEMSKVTTKEADKNQTNKTEKLPTLKEVAAENTSPPKSDPEDSPDSALEKILNKESKDKKKTNKKFNIFEATEEEVLMLRSFAEKKDSLQEREKINDEREKVLKVFEDRIRTEYKKLDQLRSTLNSQLTELKKNNDDKVKSQVKIFESMKPEQAALILQGLLESDQDLCYDLIEKMKENKSALVLAAMSPDKARDVTVGLAKRRDVIHKHQEELKNAAQKK